MCLGIPGQIVDLSNVTQHQAIVDVGGVRRSVHIGLLVDDAYQGLEIGDWVLVHVGFAMSKMDDDEADRTLQMVRELGQAYEDEMDQIRASTPT